MQLALQLLEQIPQLVQATLSNRILNIEISENRPSKVPTGQMVLQYNRPCLNDNQVTIPKTTTAYPRLSKLVDLSSTGLTE